MSDSQLNDSSIHFDALTHQQRHDLKTALLSVKWSAQLLKPVDGSQPPCEAISDQLMNAYEQLRPFIEKILAEKGMDSQ